jgi:hypothetical protein
MVPNTPRQGKEFRAGRRGWKFFKVFWGGEGKLFKNLKYYTKSAKITGFWVARFGGKCANLEDWGFGGSFSFFRYLVKLLNC